MRGSGILIAEIHLENSEVLLAGSVAVAETTQLLGKVAAKYAVKSAVHEPANVTLVCPRNNCPSP